MAKTFKPMLGDDIVTTRTLLHEAIPITGTISSGTYINAGSDTNIKTFSHGMFESVYDYPYLSSSANHIFDLTYGCSSNASSSANTQNAKKLNIYNQMAQVLFGYDISGNIRNFESDGIVNGSNAMDQCFFVNFSRLLTKDEVKKNSFRFTVYTSGTIVGDGSGRNTKLTIGDYGSATEYRTSPSGDYAMIYTSSATTNTGSGVGLLFYQAGIAVLTASVDLFSGSATTWDPSLWATTTEISGVANNVREVWDDVDFNNTIELNSAIYFCRVNHNEYNYSANPTYVSGSKIVVKNNVSDLPVTYITSVGLYSPDNELLAVAKLSEPIRKDPNTELTLRVRLDY